MWDDLAMLDMIVNDGWKWSWIARPIFSCFLIFFWKWILFDRNINRQGLPLLSTSNQWRELNYTTQYFTVIFLRIYVWLVCALMMAYSNHWHIYIYGWYCLYVVGLVVDCLILMISMVYNSGSCRSRMDMFGIFVYLRYTLGIWLFIIPKCKTHME